MATNTGEKTSVPLGADNNILCNACGEIIVSTVYAQKISCGHIFHKTCLDRCVKTRPYCPVCNMRIVSEQKTPSTSQVQTRSQARATNNPVGSESVTSRDNNPNNDPSDATDVTQTERITQLVTNIISSQQPQLIATLGAQMSQLIENQIAVSLSRLMPSNSPVQPELHRTSP